MQAAFWELKREYVKKARPFVTQVVTVHGMDEALWITRNGKTSLKMIRKLEQPVTVKAAPERSLGEFDGTIAYGYELITVNNFTFDECEQFFQVAIP